MRNTNENEEAYITSITSLLVDEVSLRADFTEEDLDELYKLFIYHIRESYLIGRVAKGMEMADRMESGWLIDEILEENRVATEEAPQ